MDPLIISLISLVVPILNLKSLNSKFPPRTKEKSLKLRTLSTYFCFFGNLILLTIFGIVWLCFVHLQLFDISFPELRLRREYLKPFANSILVSGLLSLFLPFLWKARKIKSIPDAVAKYLPQDLTFLYIMKGFLFTLIGAMIFLPIIIGMTAKANFMTGKFISPCYSNSNLPFSAVVQGQFGVPTNLEVNKCKSEYLEEEG